MICYGSPSLTGMVGRVCSKQKKNNYSFKLQTPFSLAHALVVSFSIILIILIHVLGLLILLVARSFSQLVHS